VADALIALHRLQKDYESLQYTQQHAEDIGKLVSTCEVSLRGLESREVETGRRGPPGEARRPAGRTPPPSSSSFVKAGQSSTVGPRTSAGGELDAENT